MDAQPEQPTLDAKERVPLYSRVCSYCRHLRPVGGGFCAAFPDGAGIPEAIWQGQHQHRAPYPGDHGIQFENARPTT